jgi:aflatoxin B1 aldehyde reductase
MAICGYCVEKKYILPTVYQGNYSLVARRVETELLPVLRSFGMRYHAYSPLAGGLLLSNPHDLAERKGRWDPETSVGKLFRGMYDKPEYHKALLEYADISEESGIGKRELGYRWMVHHSKLEGAKGDGLIFGVSRFAQVKPTIEVLQKGPLERAIVERLDGIWEIVKRVAPLDVIG